MPNDIYTVNEIHRLAEDGVAPIARDLVSQWTRLNRNYRHAKIAGLLASGAVITSVMLLAHDDRTFGMGAIIALAMVMLTYVISYLVWRCWVLNWLRWGDHFLHTVEMNRNSPAIES